MFMLEIQAHNSINTLHTSEALVNFDSNDQIADIHMIESNKSLSDIFGVTTATFKL